MARALRITVNNTDYNFTILNSEPITKGTSEIPISIDNLNITLIKSVNKWLSKESDAELNQYPLDEIGRAIALRYRL